MGKTHLRVVTPAGGGRPFVRVARGKAFIFRKPSVIKDIVYAPENPWQMRYWRAELVRTLQVIVEIRQHTEAREDETPLLTLGERLARRRRARDAEAKAQ